MDLLFVMRHFCRVIIVCCLVCDCCNVALVLNLATGLISPQYHVVFADDYSVFNFITRKKQPTNWENLCHYHAGIFQGLSILQSNSTILGDM
jgi:hypothetical protein